MTGRSNLIVSTEEHLGIQMCCTSSLAFGCTNKLSETESWRSSNAQHIAVLRVKYVLDFMIEIESDENP